MMADTKVITKPNTSRLIKINLFLKFPNGGLVITFFEPCRVDRVLGLRSGLASGLTFIGLPSGLTLALTFAGLHSGLASGLTIFGLRGVTGLFIRKRFEASKHDQFYLSGTMLFNN